jgi:hypothetical protein
VLEHNTVFSRDRIVICVAWDNVTVVYCMTLETTAQRFSLHAAPPLYLNVTLLLITMNEQPNFTIFCEGY